MFDSRRRRLWIVCEPCGHWNLVPGEEHWEAVAECERIGASSKARLTGSHVGTSATTAGLELLSVAGVTSTDIANHRYGRRLRRPQYGLRWFGAAIGAVAIVLGIQVGVALSSWILSTTIAACVALWLGYWWRNPSQPWVHVDVGDGRRVTILPWDVQRIHTEVLDETAPPNLVVPARGGTLWLQGRQAAHCLASLLPQLNGAEYAVASVQDAVERLEATDAEFAAEFRSVAGGDAAGRSRHVLRPWERLAIRGGTRVTRASADERLLLEMAATEETEQWELEPAVDTVLEHWHDG